jgi:hypothetical protein
MALSRAGERKCVCAVRGTGGRQHRHVRGRSLLVRCRSTVDGDRRGFAAVRQCSARRGLQAGPDNPLIGLERRADLLRRLGACARGAAGPVRSRRASGASGRFPAHSGGRTRAGRVLLETLLLSLSSIWPSGLVVEGVCIGDAGLHPAVRTGDITSGIVPFHKLSQWLTYSLIEPLEMAGLTVVDLDRLTALAGIPQRRPPDRPRRRAAPAECDADPQPAQAELVVEWRALTVSLMDDLLDPVRRRLGLGADFSLPHMLQGGTWSAGRKIARELRPPDGRRRCHRRRRHGVLTVFRLGLTSTISLTLPCLALPCLALPVRALALALLALPSPSPAPSQRSAPCTTTLSRKP